MKRSPSLLVAAGLALGGAVLTLTATSCSRTSEAAPAASPSALVERGRYLINISGCNDCHTPDFIQKGAAVPEADRLTGVPLGWRGPWGTSYAANLRRSLAAYDDPAVWIKMVRSRQGLPPMPWPSLQAMTDVDLTALHAYIRSLPVTGEVMPAPVPPDRDPSTPWLLMEPVMPQK